MIQYRAAKADLQSAEADFKRYEDLKNKKFISASEFDRRLASVEAARAKYEQIIESIGFVTLRSSDAGRLTEFKISVGQIISVQDVVGRVQLTHATTQKSKSAQQAQEKGIYIPVTAIHSDGKSVYKVNLDKDSSEFGTLVLAELELGRVNDQSAEVIKGLAIGDRVIATGWHALSAGQKVRIALTEKAQ
jgi:multidrug efflux pump subunit AcrA (membrane-fusion protein)